MGALGQALASGSIPVVGGIIQSWWDNKLAGKQKDWNIEQWQRQANWQKSMWHEQNAYNHPQQQMARLAEAGLNPNLMYGKGTVGQAGPVGNAGDVKGYTRAQARNVLEGTKVFEKYNQFKNLQATHDNIQANTDLTIQKEQTELWNTLLKYQQALTQENINWKDRMTMNEQIANIKAQLGLTNSQINVNKAKAKDLGWDTKRKEDTHSDYKDLQKYKAIGQKISNANARITGEKLKLEKKKIRQDTFLSMVQRRKILSDNRLVRLNASIREVILERQRAGLNTNSDEVLNAIAQSEKYKDWLPAALGVKTAWQAAERVLTLFGIGKLLGGRRGPKPAKNHYTEKYDADGVFTGGTRTYSD